MTSLVTSKEAVAAVPPGADADAVAQLPAAGDRAEPSSPPTVSNGTGGNTCGSSSSISSSSSSSSSTRASSLPSSAVVPVVPSTPAVPVAVGTAMDPKTKTSNSGGAVNSSSSNNKKKKRNKKKKGSAASTLTENGEELEQTPGGTNSNPPEVASAAFAGEDAQETVMTTAPSSGVGEGSGGDSGGGRGVGSDSFSNGSVATAASVSRTDYIHALQGERSLRARKAASNAPKQHKFWDTQPMKKPGEDPDAPGEIETKTIADVKPEPYNMAAGFEWCHVDVMDEAEADEVYTLLSENYVEDDDNMFRFDYSKEFLRWALTPPGYSPELHVGVRNSKGKLMGLITAVPTQMRIMESSIKTVEINFLCVHKKLRAKRLAPVLIKEVTRRVNLMGVWQAVYTAGVVLPTPLACCRYYHRSLNPKKLIEVGFSRLANRMTMARTLKLYKLPDSTNSPNMDAMTKDDVPSAHALLTSYLKQFKLAPQLSVDEFAHWLLPRKGVVDCFVVKDEDGKVTDMCSFYHLPSTVIGHDKHRTLNAAYSFYNVATTYRESSLMWCNLLEYFHWYQVQVTMTELMRDSLILARNLGMDVFNALNLMQNKEFLQTLKFGIGDGHLQYYLYNWRCKEVTPEEVGLVLL